MKKYWVTFNDIKNRVNALAPQICRNDILYGVPRGGVPVAMYMAAHFGCALTSVPKAASIIVDDLIDSGTTKKRYTDEYPDANFLALFDKRLETNLGWLVFPWESDDENNDRSTEDIFIRLLEYIGEDPTREGLSDTPKRMAKAWKEWTSGYQQNPRDLVTEFTEPYDEMILLKDIPFYSHCEHHLAPFFGVAHIGYISGTSKVLGISKLGRILDMYARRLQIQERLTTQIADCIVELINPAGVAVVIEARHLCTESRGLSKHGQLTVTSSMKGVFREKEAARAEFLQLIKK